MDHEAGVLADLSPLQQWATQVHELYSAMQQAGFTGPEALVLIGGMLKQPETD
jgi:hypothetical protein